MGLKHSSVLTTGQVAKYCGVNFRTVIRWVKRGLLKAYQLPGRGDNRIELGDFIEFLKAHRMPVPAELAELVTTTAVVYSTSESRSRLLRQFCEELPRRDFRVILGDSPLEIAAALEVNSRQVLAVEARQVGEVIEVLNFINQNAHFNPTVILFGRMTPEIEELMQELWQIQPIWVSSSVALEAVISRLECLEL